MVELTEQKSTHRVKVSLGYTRNMGDFESLRVDFGLEADGTGHPDATFARIYGWCEDKLVEKLNELSKELSE